MDRSEGKDGPFVDWPVQSSYTQFMSLYLMSNTIQYYDWGSTTAIPELLGFSPAAEGDVPRPVAELWMGAHPKSPSRVQVNGTEVSLLDLITEDPVRMLGETVYRAYGTALPYLFKVLAAEKALSIQSHPDEKQAQEGFARENSAGIPVDSPQRNYRDPNHKPELMCALTPFWGLRGFRPIGHILEDFRAINDPSARSLLRMLSARSDETGLREFFSHLMSIDGSDREQLVRSVVEYSETRWLGYRARGVPDPRSSASGIPAISESSGGPERFFWITAIAADFPGDIGILGPLYLNTVRLAPGEGMYLPAGVLHAYLHGTGIELMANSDNVLRGGCTSKHIDLPELQKTVQFVPDPPSILLPEGEPPASYRSGAREFRLSVAHLGGAAAGIRLGGGTPRIVLCTDGACTIREEGGANVLDLHRGQSAFLGADSTEIRIDGDGRAFIAGVMQEAADA